MPQVTRRKYCLNPNLTPDMTPLPRLCSRVLRATRAMHWERSLLQLRLVSSVPIQILTWQMVVREKCSDCSRVLDVPGSRGCVSVGLEPCHSQIHQETRRSDEVLSAGEEENCSEVGTPPSEYFRGSWVAPEFSGLI